MGVSVPGCLGAFLVVVKIGKALGRRWLGLSRWLSYGMLLAWNTRERRISEIAYVWN